MGSGVLPPGQPEPLQPGEWKGASVPNVIGFKTAGVDPPSALYIQRDDVLLLVGISQATPILTLTARLWLATEGRISTIQATLNLPVADSPRFLAIPLAEGYLLDVVVSSSNGTQSGADYVVVFINRGPTAALPSTPGGVLISDYVVGTAGAAWPNGRISRPGDTGGAITSNAVANPAAGADWTFTPSTQRLSEIVSVTATLTTSATAGARNVQIQILDQLNQVTFVSTANASIPASTAATVNASQVNQTSILITTTVFLVVPPRNLLAQNHKLKSATTGILAGDQWSNIIVSCRQWEVI